MTIASWYVDSSVMLRMVKEGSVAVRRWFDEAVAAGDVLIASRLMPLEIRRTLHNHRLSLSNANISIGRFLLLSVDDALLDEAEQLAPVLRGADAIHLASALRVGGPITVVTHDAQMAAAARQLGLAVLDPVTDDPTRPPVA